MFICSKMFNIDLNLYILFDTMLMYLKVMLYRNIEKENRNTLYVTLFDHYKLKLYNTI